MPQLKVPQHPQIRLERDDWGVIQISADHEADLYRGMGYAHALDRSSQLLLMRILGRGQGCEYLDDSDEMLVIDSFFRRMNWQGDMQSQLTLLSSQARSLCEAYCEGLNLRLLKHPPKLFRLLGYKPTPWTLEDCILLSRMTGYLTLAQSQAELERFIVQMVQHDVSLEHLEDLFPGQLTGLEPELLKQVPLSERVVPEAVKWQSMVAGMMASNSWVVAPSRSISGQAMLANDPHLEGNRLPNVWYELSLKQAKRYALCATMPGLPGILIGRTNDLAWGATYTFMDAVDSWIEDCKDGKYRRKDEWLPFTTRREVIKRKKHSDVCLTFYENPHGVLEGNPHKAGYYLSTQWSASHSGARSLEAMLGLWQTPNVERGMQELGQLETAWNWVLADAEGNIGYQMSGLMPMRRQGVSGLVPLPGWEPENDWQGWVAASELPRSYNPEQGYFVTANNDLNVWGQAQPINSPMGAYRAERIASLLTSKDQLSPLDLQQIQQDTYSLQAQKFLETLGHLLPETPQGQLLKNWDCHYRADSVEAGLFEKLYRRLFNAVFGQVLGPEVSQAMETQTGLLADFYAHFDKVLLAEASPWFQGQSRDDFYRPLIAEALKDAPSSPWKSQNQFVLKHILLGGKLPRWAGFDYGPIPLKGGRATPHQGQLYQSGSRQTSFMPTLRLVTDFAEDSLLTCLLGGPSDHPRSRWYTSEIDNWLQGRYKKRQPK